MRDASDGITWPQPSTATPTPPDPFAAVRARQVIADLLRTTKPFTKGGDDARSAAWEYLRSTHPALGSPTEGEQR